jgi:hypothetical protein
MGGGVSAPVPFSQASLVHKCHGTGLEIRHHCRSKICHVLPCQEGQPGNLSAGEAGDTMDWEDAEAFCPLGLPVMLKPAVGRAPLAER